MKKEDTREKTKQADTAITTENATNEKESTVVKRKKKVRKTISHAKVYIQANFNNTIISITDLDGNVIAWSSAGHCGFKGARKSTPYAAQVAAEKAIEKASVYGVTDMDVFVKGVGAGRDQSVRGLIAKSNANILSIKDITPIPHGGCRKKKVRRQ